jgi:ABC-type multidrug transport system ATPase subunit
VTSEALVADRLSKSYGRRPALREVSFRIDRGESVAYLGPNGAGKTTTLKLLSGLTRPSSGSARILGADPSRDRDGALSGVGTLLESPGVPPYLTSNDLLTYCARARGIPARERPQAVLSAIQDMVPEDVLHQSFGSLSTGTARRVLLAASLTGDPEILLLDEPTIGLDPAARSDLRRTLRTLVGRGKTILLSTHLLEDAQEVCDRVLFLREGVLVGDEPVHLGRGAEPTRAIGTMRLRFAAAVPPASIAALAMPGVTFLPEDPRQVLVRFDGDEALQAEIIARTVRAGLPLIGATEPEPDLARRYLETVGREEAT